MLYFHYRGDKLLAVTENTRSYPGADREVYRDSKWTYAIAEQVARDATELTGKLHVPCDSGPNVWPRYDVLKAPELGEHVSYGFNGDYYPDGVVTYVTPGDAYLVRTSTGNEYRRRRLNTHGTMGGAWIQRGGTWSLVRGVHDKRNPSF